MDQVSRDLESVGGITHGSASLKQLKKLLAKLRSRLAGISMSDKQVTTRKMEEVKNDSVSLSNGGDNIAPLLSILVFKMLHFVVTILCYFYLWSSHPTIQTDFFLVHVLKINTLTCDFIILFFFASAIKPKCLGICGLLHI